MRNRNFKRTVAYSITCGVVVGSLAFGSSSALAESSLERVSEPNLKPYTIVDGTSIPKSFTGKPGNPANGKKLFVHRKKGNCLTCHTAPIPEQQFHGQVAPDLAGVADRMTEGEIRLRIVNPKLMNPDTPMMAYYKTHGLNQVKKSFVGKPMLNEQELEDVIAYLMTLK
ncbi:sulfur oxidation c-type cytochrome SoxX [Terasakiella sp. SH-1]|uniref:sulfur oxidation c-type cytochrome SoxX n=1 Tax=Terasakiella sp. SH-1 TaxID=2560057 RepID=UPI0010740AAE|nr:sulfur oxidation c-type cytochrome SoxX [Terasakiella sp. SH-1]